MNTYTSFYFLHVPKTGGRFLSKYIIDPIKKQLSENGIEVLKNPELQNAKRNRHVGWHWGINSETYIVSCFREPVEWACSYFIHMMYIEFGALDMDNEAIVIKNIEKKFNGEDLIKWLTENKFLQNYQSKNYILGAGNNSSIKHEIILHNKNDGEINKNFLYKRLQRVNLLFRQGDLKNIEPSLLVEKISQDLGIKIDYRPFEDIDNSYYANNASKALYDSLSNFERDSIKSLLAIDVEIYNNDTLFWSTR